MTDFKERSHPSGSEEMGGIVKTHRARARLTQRGLAEASKIHYSTIQKLETGDRGMGMETFAKLADVLGDEFIEDVIYHVAKEY